MGMNVSADDYRMLGMGNAVRVSPSLSGRKGAVPSGPPRAAAMPDWFGKAASVNFPPMPATLPGAKKA